MWFGAMRVDGGELPIGNLTAFLQYLMQILFAVLTAVFMFIFVPRAAVSAGPHPGGARRPSPSIHDPAAAGRRCRRPARPARRRRVPRRRVPLPGRRGARPARHLVHGAARPDHGHRRQHRQRQDDARSTSSRASTTRRRARCSSTASTCARCDREDLWARIGFVPQKAFLFSGTVASNLRYGDERRHRRGALAGARDRPGPRLRRARWTASSRRRSPRAARTSRAASASAWPSPGRIVKRAPHLRLRRQLLRARLRDRRAAARGARRASSSDATVIIVAQRVGTIMNADQIVVMDAGRVVGIGTHAELLATNETYREIVYSQLVRGRGRGMSGARRGGPGGPATTGRRAPGGPGRPGGGPGMMGMGMGLPAAKAKDFRGSFRRLLGHLRPERRAIVAGRPARRRQRHLRGHRAQDPGRGDQHHLRGRDRRAAAGRRDPGSRSRPACARSGQDQLADMLSA